MVSSAPLRSASAFRVLALALAAVYSSGTVGAQTIDAGDCSALLSWKPYAAIAPVTSCSPLPSCGDFGQRNSGADVIACNARGRVTAVDLSGNNLSGTLPKEWSAMTALTILYLKGNNLSGTLPKAWSAMTVLNGLQLQNNKLSGTLPKEWSSMTALQTLDLDTNSLSGTLPKDWGAMSSMTWLYLYNSSLSGTLPKEWSAMTALTEVVLSGNSLSGTLPKEWSGMIALTYLELGNNKLSGTLPKEWSAMTAMSSLYLHDNSLSGTLPRGWSARTALTELNLRSNSLSGTLPKEWSAMTALTYLELSNNKLSGALPKEWNAMTAMSSLYLHDNSLSGTLPKGWSVMTALIELDVAGNNLGGALPKEWSSMTALTYFHAAGTKLCGPDPFPKVTTNLPACLPSISNGRCGVTNGGSARCHADACCSRWGWCGDSAVHCDPTKGCVTAYGSCTTASPPPPRGFVLDTDPVDCGPAKHRRCRTGYCCSSSGICSSLPADCSLAKSCKVGYGLCYDSTDDLQYVIDHGFDEAGPSAWSYASNPTSNATRLSLYSFSLGSPAKVCSGLPSPCKAHTVTSGQTVERIAALHGTTTWQILLDNPLLKAVGSSGMVPLRPYDVLAVRPSPAGEALKWQWTRKEALLLGNSTYPRPCSGYSDETIRKLCFCHYHPGTGTYVWPFSTGAKKCRQAIECRYTVPTLTTCPATTVADDTEFNGQTQCLKQPSGFECSTGDGCTSVHCFCKEFLLKPATYQNPFDSTRTTGIICDWNKPGWYGGMVYCDPGHYFDPYTRDCTTKPQPNIPYRRGYTSCDGVPDPDMAPLVAKSGRRLQAYPRSKPHNVPPCNRDSCCKKGLAAGKKYGCIPCPSGLCKPGNVFAHVVSKKNKRCQCQVWGSCPMWFNKNCRFRKPSGRSP